MSMMTLFVDASHCPRTKAGGVGAWCKRDGWDRGYTLGSKIHSARDSTHAELLGIVQTLEFLASKNEFDDLGYLIVQCDSLYALHALIKYGNFEGAPPKHPTDTDARVNAHLASHKYEQLAQRASVATAGVKIKAVRHVKGHQAGQHSRSWVNEQCDAIAKTFMRTARAEAYGRAGMANKRLRAPEQGGRVEIENR